jgi:mRNA interferase HigB
VNVISRKTIRSFYNAKPARKLHAGAFEAWFKLAKRARWSDFHDLKSTLGQSDVAHGRNGRTATIFDIGGNKYRIVARVDYLRQTVRIVAIMDHAEYDKQQWKDHF